MLGGCVPSLQPLYTPETLVYTPALEGVWEESSSMWSFVGDPNNKNYKLTITTEDGDAEFEAHLVKLNQMHFLDLYPTGEGLQANEYLKIHLLAVHHFFKVKITPTMIEMRLLHPDKVADLLAEDPNAIEYQKVDDRIVFTDTPQNLQKFMKTYGADDSLFGDPGTLNRPGIPEPNEPNQPDANT